MLRRIVTLVTGLLLAAGLVSVTAGAAQAAADDPNLRISINKLSFVATQKGVVRIHLDGPGGKQQVYVYRTVSGQGSFFLGAVTTDVHGNYSFTTTLVYNATYTVSYGGSNDQKWYPAVASTPLVHVAAYVLADISGYYATKGQYHLVHNGKRGEYDAAVVPNKAGQRVRFPLEVFTRGKWRVAVAHSYKLTNHKIDGVNVSATGTSFTGARGFAYRIRAEYRGDRTDGARVTRWTYVKFA